MSDSIPIDLDKLTFEPVTLSHGESMIVARQQGIYTPIGFVWGIYTTTASAQCFMVHGSHVPEWARRQGVRRAINNYLFNQCGVDFIHSPGGTVDGKAFMEASGYKWDTYGGYYLENPKRAVAHAVRGKGGKR